VTVYIPHYLATEPVSMDLLKDLSLMATYNWGKFIGENNKDLLYPTIVSFAKHLKEKDGVSKLGVVAFCFGGWAALQLSRDNLVDAVAVAHPSLVNFPTDVENIQHPSLFLCAEVDNIFPKETALQAKELLEKKPQPHKLKIYPGTQHGFAVRGITTDEATKINSDDAAAEVVQFFNTYLK